MGGGGGAHHGVLKSWTEGPFIFGELECPRREALINIFKGSLGKQNLLGFWEQEAGPEENKSG